MKLTANLSAGIMLNFEKLIRPTLPSRDWFISISPGGKGSERIETPCVENTLYLEFFDLPGFNDPNVFSLSQAEHTAAFIRKVKANDGNLWVNCMAGISRSGAIVDLLIRLGWQDLNHPLQQTRYPNPVVWKRLVAHFPELMHHEYPFDNAQEWERGIEQYLRPRRFNYFAD